MNFLKRIANSSYVLSHCRWPSAKTLRVYWFIVAAIGLFNAAISLSEVYRNSAAHGIPHPLFAALGVTFVFLSAWALLGVMFLFVWGMYYRMGTDIAAGFRRFRAWAPGAWQSFVKAVVATIKFLLSIPSLIGRFFRALGRGLLWIAGRPAWWRGLNRSQKLDVGAGIVTTSVMIACYVLFYPVAHHISGTMPHWMAMSDVPLLQTLFVDFFLGSFIAIFAVAILTTVFGIVVRFFSKR